MQQVLEVSDKCTDRILTFLGCIVSLKTVFVARVYLPGVF